jgi:hypothetical protein
MLSTVFAIENSILYACDVSKYFIYEGILIHHRDDVRVHM